MTGTSALRGYCHCTTPPTSFYDLTFIYLRQMCAQHLGTRQDPTHAWGAPPGMQSSSNLPRSIPNHIPGPHSIYKFASTAQQQGKTMEGSWGLRTKISRYACKRTQIEHVGLPISRYSSCRLLSKELQRHGLWWTVHQGPMAKPPIPCLLFHASLTKIASCTEAPLLMIGQC